MMFFCAAIDDDAPRDAPPSLSADDGPAVLTAVANGRRRSRTDFFEIVVPDACGLITFRAEIRAEFLA